jgi:TetR/AcrR family transcriptional regulator, lmrAB and yxaGH operons repressor
MGVRTDTREQMLRTAARLFATQGYESTGLLQVVEVAGTPRGSVYFHFPGGKEQLAKEALALASALYLADITASIQKGPNTAKSFLRSTKFLAKRLQETDFLQGCPIAPVALETSGSNETLRLACAEYFEQWTHLYEQSLISEGVPSERSKRLATTIVCLIEGALLISRTQRSTRAMLDIGIEGVSMIDSVTAG